MIGLVRAEWIKWRSVRSSVALSLVILALSLFFAIVSASVYKADPTGSVQFRGTPLDVVDGNPTFVFAFLAVLGALLICTEYSQGTITPTFLNAPVRMRALMSKILLAIGLGIGIALLAQLFAFGAGALVLSTKDVSVSLGDSGAITQLIESTCFGACGVLFGVAIGVLFRQTVAAVIICIAWPILLESLASLAVPKDFRRYLPVDALTALLSKVQGADGSGHPLSSAAGVAVYFAWIVVLVAIGGFFMNRADTK
jgi:ABC-type transport system involved in multi-copper enzyme maturation permease subunit